MNVMLKGMEREIIKITYKKGGRSGERITKLCESDKLGTTQTKNKKQVHIIHPIIIQKYRL